MIPGDLLSLDKRPIPKWFWETIDAIKSSDQSAHLVFREMDKARLREFYQIFDAVAVQFRDEPFISLMGDVSEDTTIDRSETIVALGQETAEAIWRQPDLLPSILAGVPTTHIAGIAAKVYWDRFHEPIE